MFVLTFFIADLNSARRADFSALLFAMQRIGATWYVIKRTFQGGVHFPVSLVIVEKIQERHALSGGNAEATNQGKPMRISPFGALF